MRLFAIAEAAYFCSGKVPSSLLHSSLREFAESLNAGQICEETPTYDQVRAHLLRDANRMLLNATSNFVRACDLLTVVGSPWAHVTLYYGSFYAASAVMMMLGAGTDGWKFMFDVAAGTAGSQKLALVKKAKRKPISQVNGSHRVFWDFFYKGIASIRPLLSDKMQAATLAVTNDPFWLIDRRNEVNYDPESSINAMSSFKEGEAPEFPHWLSGNLGVQFQVTKGFVELAYYIAGLIKLPQSGLEFLGDGARPHKISIHVLEKLPKRLSRSLAINLS